MDTLGARLAEARRNAGYTQADVAEILEISITPVSAWERDSYAPDIEKIPKLAEIYHVSLDWLLAGKAPSRDILDVTSNLSERLFSENRMATYISAYCDAKKLYQTKRSLAFAKEKHKGTYRKLGMSGEHVPYIYHPLLMTCQALALGLEDDNLLSACLLHDVCEDCGVDPEELPVNEETREAVRRLTKPAVFDHSDEADDEYYRGICENKIAIMVKLLDRCNNISSMAGTFSDEKMASYIKETEKYVPVLTRIVKSKYPEYSNQLFLIRYHMNSVLEALKHEMRKSVT